MKRIVGFVAIAVTLCAGTTEVLAQETQYLRTPHHFTLFFDAGIAIPAAPEIFKRAWNTTLPINIGIGYSVFAWWDVNIVFSRASFGSNSLGRLTGSLRNPFGRDLANCAPQILILKRDETGS